MKAVAKSERLLEEDVMREAGFMLPQGKNAENVLRKLVDSPHPSDFPSETVADLLGNNNENDRKEVKNMKTYKCLICRRVTGTKQVYLFCISS